MSQLILQLKLYSRTFMFKKLIEESALSQRPLSPIRTQTLPFKSKKFDQAITATGKSPFRNRQRELNDLKYLMDNNVPKVKTATPVKGRSPISDYQLKGNNFYKKISQPFPGERSPLKARPFNEIFQINPRSNYYKPEESNRTYMTETDKENKKQNFQLFTMLVGEIKLNNQFSRHNSQADPIPTRPSNIKPELSQFSELLRQKSPQSRKTQPLLMRAISAGCPNEKEDSMLISNGMHSNRENRSIGVGTCRQTPIEQAVKESASKDSPKQPIIVNFSLGMQSNVKMVESVKPPPEPLIIPSPQINQSGEQDSLMDRVNESQEVDFSNMQDRLNMDPCL